MAEGKGQVKDAINSKRLILHIYILVITLNILELNTAVKSPRLSN